MDPLTGPTDRRPSAEDPGRAADRAAAASAAARTANITAINAAVEAAARVWVETGQWSVDRAATASHPGGNPKALAEAAQKAVVRAGLTGIPWGHCQEWAAAGLITPRAAHRDRIADGDPRWTRLPPAAARWAVAGFSPEETIKLMALPDGHANRPGDDQLAVMTALRRL